MCDVASLASISASAPSSAVSSSLRSVARCRPSIEDSSSSPAAAAAAISRFRIIRRRINRSSSACNFLSFSACSNNRVRWSKVNKCVSNRSRGCVSSRSRWGVNNRSIRVFNINQQGVLHVGCVNRELAHSLTCSMSFSACSAAFSLSRMACRRAALSSLPSPAPHAAPPAQPRGFRGLI